MVISLGNWLIFKLCHTTEIKVSLSYSSKKQLNIGRKNSPEIPSKVQSAMIA
uniref:Uncharacterized protein n=1 Tax=Anguilla anguilla TaxID=7936 RepID=A0A0E9PK80_ANGAN